MPESIFNEVVNKKIIAFDLFGNKHEKDLVNFKFRISVYGILFEDNKILLQRNPLITQFGLPGGGIELGETISDSLEREFLEETGLVVKTKNLFDVSQDFFTHEGKCAHSILIFYHVEKTGGELKADSEDSVEVKYFGLDELNESNTQRINWPIIEKLRKDNTDVGNGTL